jgi:uncharacterized protein
VPDDRRASVRVRVVPRARRTAIARDPSGALRVHVTAPPVDDAANDAVLTLLAERLGVRRHDLAITRGARGRDKVIAVDGMDAAELARRIAHLASHVDKADRRG